MSAIAPQHLGARKARARGWRVLEPQTVASTPRTVEPAENGAARPAPQQRFLLWIDGVGGYLGCLANRVTLRQAPPDAHLRNPLFARVSPIPASLSKDLTGH